MCTCTLTYTLVCVFSLLQYKPLSETESSQESDCGEGPSSQTMATSRGEESDFHGDSSSQVTSQETATEDDEATATAMGKYKIFTGVPEAYKIL